MPRRFVYVCVVLTVVLISSTGCNDLGMNPPTPSPPPKVDTAKAVSFQNNVIPIFINYGCYGCHGGTNGLYVTTVADLLKGGIHGPAIIPGNADSSLIMKKTSPNPPFGARMPMGGPYCPDSIRAVIAAWINQGAKDN